MLNITKSMELSNMIKESEWFCAIEGIAIAERIYNIYDKISPPVIIIYDLLTLVSNKNWTR